MPRTLADVDQDIHSWIAASQPTFDQDYVEGDGRSWVLKFFTPEYLAGFMRRPELVISTSPGFTWGDGVYVVPLRHVYSAMIYGRVGVMGWVDSRGLKIYDAANPVGLALYREWIQYKPGLFTLLTTTVHSQFANRRLRNRFRSAFGIDIVFFRPDEFNRAYVQPGLDRWCVISDFSISRGLPAGTVGFSKKVRECELVAIGTEEFARTPNGLMRQDLIGPQVRPAGVHASSRVPLEGSLRTTYLANRVRTSGAPTYLIPKP